MRKNILIVTQYFTPDITAAAFRMNDLYNSIKNVGHKVSVITTYPHKVKLSNNFEIDGEEDVFRLKISDVKKRGFLSYLQNFFGFMVKSIYFGIFKLRKEKFNYIIVSSPPLFIGISGVILAKFKRAKLILDVRDIWPDSAVAAGMISESSILYKLTKRLEILLYNKADEIICVSQPMKEYIESKSDKTNISVLYNGISLSEFDYSKNPHFKGVNDKKNRKFKILYTGNIGAVQNLDIIIKANEMLAQQKMDSFFEFIIIGEGVERERLEKSALSKGMENIIFTGPKSKEELLPYLNSSDALFLDLKRHWVLEKTIPSKLFDYLLEDKPILSGILGEGKDIMDQLGCGIQFDSDDPATLVTALYELRNSELEYKKVSLDNSSYVIENFDRRKMFEILGMRL